MQCSVFSIQKNGEGRTLLRLRRPHYGWVVALAVLCLLWTGCGTFGGFSTKPLASVTVWNQPPAKIEDATMAVFRQYGYSGRASAPGKMTFERPGTTADNVAYGSLMFNSTITERVVVTMMPNPSGGTVLSCKATLVEDAGDPQFEDSHKVGGEERKMQYNDMLRQVQLRLQKSE